MSYRLDITIDGLPVTANGCRRLGHWSKVSKATKSWKTSVWAMALQAGRPNAPLAKAKLTLVRYSSVEPDFDGLVHSFKPVIDGLKLAGVILDDKRAVVGQPEYEWQRADPRAGRIRVIVEERE